MSSQYFTLYKMIVLYMLRRCEESLTKAQIYDFVLEGGYTDFLTLQAVFSELADTSLIVEKTVANRTYLEITAEGSQALDFFGNRINPSIRSDIDRFIKDNSLKIRDEASIQGNYIRTGENEYTAHLLAKENGRNILDIRLTLPTEEIAENTVRKWHEKNQEIYQFLILNLMSEE